MIDSWPSWASPGVTSHEPCEAAWERPDRVRRGAESVRARTTIERVSDVAARSMQYRRIARALALVAPF